MALVVKNPSDNTGDIRNMGLIPGSGRSPGERNGNQSCVLAWRIPRPEEPGGLQSIVSQSDTTEYDLVHVHLYFKYNVYGTRYMLSSLVCVQI